MIDDLAYQNKGGYTRNVYVWRLSLPTYAAYSVYSHQEIPVLEGEDICLLPRFVRGFNLTRKVTRAVSLQRHFA